MERRCKESGRERQMENLELLVVQLRAKKPAEGYAALKALLAESERSNCVAPYLPQFVAMLDSDSSYLRTRALLLLAANARWDIDNCIDENIDRILAHITDPKPITARQLIQNLPVLALAKPDLRGDILAALHRADTRRYPLSMRSLVEEDIRKAVLAINAQESGEA